MKNFMLLLLIICLAVRLALAADELTQTLRGTVTDAVTGYPIIGATVLLVNSSPLIGSSTDVNGKFELRKVPLGRQTVVISYIGYETKTISNLFLVSGKEMSVDVKLEEKVTSIGEVVVAPQSKKAEIRNEMATVSARTFSVEETERFAGSLGDPARMVANYAGVMTQNDSRNDIIIRGNSPAGVLWKLEGIEIPNPNHFGAQGTTGGPVSMVNNNLLSNSDFLTGAFPAEYSNALSGVFDINLRSGNSNEHEFTGQVGFNGFELGAEGPLMKLKNGQNASYIANYRYSTLELMNNLGFNIGTGTAIPKYNDMTFLVDVPGKKAGRIKLFGLWGKSFIGLGRDLTDTGGNQYNERGIATDFGSELGVIGLTHTFYFDEKTRLKTTLSWQHSKSSALLDSIQNETFIPFIRQNQTENKLSFSTQLRRKFSASDNVSAGIIIDNYSIDYIDSLKNRDYGRFITYTDINGSMNLYRGYVQWQHKYDGRFTSYAGINVQHFALNGETAIEPRLGLNFITSEKGSLNAGFGLHSQIQAKGTYFYQDYDSVTDTYSRTNENLKFTKSAHFVLGYQQQINNDFRIKVETYYQHIYNAPVKKSFPEFSLINFGDQFGAPIEDSLVNKGKGKNYGAEITIEKFLDHGWYFLFTSSLFNSKYAGWDKIWRNTAFNGNYVFNLLGGYEYKIKEHMMLTVDLKTVWAGGKRYVPVDLAASVARKEDVRDWSRAYSNKYDDYFRTDLRFGLKMNSRRFSQEWGIDLQNITGFRSIFMEGFDLNKGETYKVYQQGFVPMFLYRIQF
jgi:hypothetical protein